MSILDLFESGEMKEHKGAFRNLVMIARADGVISEQEEAMLKRMAKRLDLRDDQVEDILKNPTAYPMHPPVNIQERRERMVDLVRMVMVDGEIDSREMSTLQRCAIGLGYHESDIPFMVNRIHHYIREGLDRNGVIEAMLSEQE
jgi:uncharacterized tellurite resistance protein B-like protein